MASALTEPTLSPLRARSSAKDAPDTAPNARCHRTSLAFTCAPQWPASGGGQTTPGRESCERRTAWQQTAWQTAWCVPGLPRVAAASNANVSTVAQARPAHTLTAALTTAPRRRSMGCSGSEGSGRLDTSLARHFAGGPHWPAMARLGWVWLPAVMVLTRMAESIAPPAALKRWA